MRINSAMEISLHPIGVIHSPFTEKKKMPIQASRSQAIGKVEVFPGFRGRLEGY